MRDRILTVVMVSAVIAAAALLYYPTLDYGFVWDDHDILFNVPEITGESHWTTAFSRPVDRLYRPLRSISYRVDNALMEVPRGYHLTNVLLFAAGCGLFFIFARVLLGNTLWGFCAAMLYAAHPSQAEVVPWITGGRANLLAALFVFATMALYIAAARRRPGEGAAGAHADSPGGARNGSVAAYFFMSCAAFILALVSKESAIVAPGLIFIYEIVFSEKGPGFLKTAGRALFRTLPFLAIAGLFLYFRFSYVGISGQFSDYHGGSRASTLISMLPVLADYMAMTIAPAGLCPVYTPEIFETAATREVLVAGAALVAAAAVGAALWRRAPVAAFAAGWFFAALLPVSNLIPIASMKAVRFMSLPAAGVCILVAYTAGAAVRKAAGNTKAGAAVLLALTAAAACYWGAHAAGYRDIWRNDMTLWSAGVECAPDSHIAHNNLGRVYNGRGMREEAAAEFEKALEIEPGFTTIRKNLARAYAGLGRYDEAHHHYEALVLQNAFVAENLLALIAVKVKMGRRDEALTLIERFLSHPELPVDLREELQAARRRIEAAE